MRRIGLIAWATLALVACKKHPSPASVPPTTSSMVAGPAPSASASAVATSEPVPPALPQSCATFEKDLDDKLRAAIVALGDAGTSWKAGDLLNAKNAEGLGCVPFTRGAWMMVPGALDVSISMMITTDVTVTAVVDGHAVAPWSADGTGIHVGAAGMPISMSRMLVGDYDGDGIPELWVRTDEDGVEGGHFSQTWILTVHDDKVDEYAPSKKLTGDVGTPTDVDGDGRLDMPVSLGLAEADSGYCFGKSTGIPAHLLAHSLADGTFSTDDAVAVAYAERQCPRPPVAVTTAAEAVCAVLWTAPADLPALRARVAASCVEWDCGLEYAGQAQKPGATHDCNNKLDTLDQEIGAAAPLRDRLTIPQAPARRPSR